MIARDWPNNRLPQLAQTGPPVNKVQLKIQRCYTLADLRKIPTNQDNDKWMVLLLGELEAYDGGLQGFYDYVPTGRHLSRVDDGGSWIIVEDGSSAWFKVT